MSNIYLSALVIILNHALPLIGLDWGNDQITTFAQSLIDIILSAWIMYRRHSTGDINAAGIKTR